MVITSKIFNQGQIISDQLEASCSKIPIMGLMAPVVFSLTDTFAASVGVQPFGHLY